MSDKKDSDFVSRVYKKKSVGIKTLAKIAGELSGESPLYKKNSYASWGAMCPRRAVLHNKISRSQMIPMTASSAFFFSGGTAFHEVIQDAFYNAGILYGREIRVEYNGIAGFIDIVFKDEDGQMGLIDIKTCGSKVPSWPKLEYVQQIRTYGLLTNIDRLYILYISRNVVDYKMNLKWRMIRVPLLNEDKINTAMRLAWGLVGKEENILPDIPSDISSEKDCGWCPFKTYCWGESEDDKLRITKYNWGAEGEPTKDWLDREEEIKMEVIKKAKEIVHYGKFEGHKNLLSKIRK